MNSRAIKLVLITGIVLAIAGLAAILMNTGVTPSRESGAKPIIGGPFELVGSKGQVIRDTDYRGRHFLVFFGYTHCPDVCPTALVTIGEAFDRLDADEIKKVRAAFISVDPDRDTPELLGEFTSSFHANIDGMTGTREQIDSTVKAYKAAYRIRKGEDPEYYPVDHSSIIYLMNRDGEYVTHFSHRSEVDKVVAVLKDELQK